VNPHAPRGDARDQAEHVQTECSWPRRNRGIPRLAHGEKYGYKNSQVTVWLLRPIGFMDGLRHQRASSGPGAGEVQEAGGGGLIKNREHTVPRRDEAWLHPPEQTSEIVSYIDKNGKIEGAAAPESGRHAGFDARWRRRGGGRSIHWTGHVKMMAAAQPFLSGAIRRPSTCPRIDCRRRHEGVY